MFEPNVYFMFFNEILKFISKIEVVSYFSVASLVMYIHVEQFMYIVIVVREYMDSDTIEALFGTLFLKQTLQYAWR